MKVNRLKRDEPEFPANLKNIASSPAQLFWTGANPSSWIDRPKVAVVGSRKATAYGRSVTEKLVFELARAGVVIISGLALGIDSIAHKSALAADGTTVAVLPGGLDKIYPASHHNLARQITTSGGTLLGEYPPGSLIYKQNFIARNRLVSGLADALLITEAAAASGTLHTVSFALDQGRTVMAVPGNITSPSSAGSNNLIKSGALPVTDARDIFFVLKMNPVAAEVTHFSGTPEEKAVLDQIRSGISDQEAIAVTLGLDAPSVGFCLTYLEISGFIKPAGAGRWLAS